MKEDIADDLRGRDEQGERQKVGGPVLATIGRGRENNSRDQSLEGFGRSLTSACDAPTPDFLALSLYAYINQGNNYRYCRNKRSD